MKGYDDDAFSANATVTLSALGRGVVFWHYSYVLL
jgi:hypothetical protein